MLTSHMPILPGETLAKKYRIDRLLGQGGMGVVVAAHHLDLETSVAIKFLSIMNAGASVDRFLREARAAAKVKSEHVCKVFDVGRLDSGEPYIVMEHLEGMDLGEKLEQEGPQRLEDVATWMVQACDALSEAHERGIVHRDLKPANIFLARRDDDSLTAKVLDFGISKLPQGAATARGRVGSTTAQGIVGSPLYMAPEQMESASSVDARADIWSVGITIYELLTREMPFMGESIIALALNIREGLYRPLRDHQPHLPPEIEAVVARCLQKDPSARFPNIAALAEAIAPFAPVEVQVLAKRIARRHRGASSDDPARPSDKSPAAHSEPRLVLADSSPSDRRTPPSSDPRLPVADPRTPQPDSQRKTPVSDKRAYENTEVATPSDRDSSRGLKATLNPVSTPRPVAPGQPQPQSSPRLDSDPSLVDSANTKRTRSRTLAVTVAGLSLVALSAIVITAVRRSAPNEDARTSSSTPVSNTSSTATPGITTETSAVSSPPVTGEPTSAPTEVKPAHKPVTVPKGSVKPVNATSATATASAVAPAPPPPTPTVSVEPVPTKKPPKHHIDKDNPYDVPEAP